MGTTVGQLRKMLKDFDDSAMILINVPYGTRETDAVEEVVAEPKKLPAHECGCGCKFPVPERMMQRAVINL